MEIIWIDKDERDIFLKKASYGGCKIQVIILNKMKVELNMNGITFF